MIANDNHSRDALAAAIVEAIVTISHRHQLKPGDAIIATAVALGCMVAEYANEGAKDEVMRNVAALMCASAE